MGKAYRVIRPQPNDPKHLLRVIDEEGEDYLYPAEYFAAIELPQHVRKAMQAAA